MGHEQDRSADDQEGGLDGFDQAVETAWSRFRVRLADRVDATAIGGEVVICVPDPTHATGRRPGLGVLVSVDDVLTLDIDVHQGHREERLPRGQVDRAAARAVAVLREELAVLHPSMVDAEGLETDRGPQPPTTRPAWHGEDPGTSAGDPADPTDRVITPRDRDHLQELVDGALGRMLGEVRHDPDGDVPIRDGSSVCWVSVRGDRPVVELFAELVHDAADPAAVRREVALLNEEHEAWKFVERGDAVVMRTELLALPFCESHLVVAARLFTEAMDDLARHLVERIGGRRFLEEDAGPGQGGSGPPDGRSDDPVPSAVLGEHGLLEVAGLVELLVLGPVRPATVAGLFGHDRHQIIRQLVALRTGSSVAGARQLMNECPVDIELVLTALRQALRLVSDGPRPGTGDVPRRRRSVQAPLVADVEPGEDTLDLGWST